MAGSFATPLHRGSTNELVVAVDASRIELAASTDGGSL
jgi:hypothetical protein